LHADTDRATTPCVEVFGGVIWSWAAISHDVSEPVGTSEYARLK
jgi:hypothetical protein